MPEYPRAWVYNRYVFIPGVSYILSMATATKTYRVHNAGGQLKVTIPKVLAQAVGIGAGDRVVWVVDRGELVLRKVD